MQTAFQKDAFQNDAFQIFQVAIGSGSSARRKAVKKQQESKVIEFPVVHENIELLLNSIALKLKTYPVEILTTSNTIIELQGIQLKISINPVDIETSVSYYDEQEFIKLLLILSA